MAQTPYSPPPIAASPRMSAVIFSYGFRPFFLMAAIFSPLAILVWLGVYSGTTTPVSIYPPSFWHAHEMIFGFAGAVMTGFFLTAVPNWTGAAPVRGPALVVLAALWLAGRVAIWATPLVPPILAAAVDLSFFPALAVVILPSLLSGARKNMIFLVILALLVTANLLFHLEAIGAAQTASLGLNFAVDLFALLITIIGGRVTPAFTANALRAKAQAQGVKVLEPSGHMLLNEAAILSVAAVAICDLVVPGYSWVGAVAIFAAVVNAVRLAGWRTRHTFGEPLLWVLHLGYTWLVIGLAVKGVARLTDFLPPTVALHGITIGAIGTMTLAMMSRASLGHTGRALIAGRALAVAYLFVSLAAIVRLFTSLALPENYMMSVVIAGALWIAGFVIFALRFVPILTAPRADG